MLKISVITVSDRAYSGEYEDRSGPAIVKVLEESGINTKIHCVIVPDDKNKIKNELELNLGKDYIFTTGGTGISPRDFTPDVTRQFCDYELPGIQEYLRAESLKETPFALFSRGFCGIKGRTIIVNFPGSVKGAAFCSKLMIPLLEHGVKMIRGEKH